ncbi:hypothetical protein F5148DRAFT_253082 [Russula earlei]|uniref:Uncharacterized protein n=1 Tax=Russula earlei TaxID=71964 RepID=A0ACC0U5H1_9AGAM|nr:hypothetical protein F5148DRAFT_253082 [Russula earlei]
MTPPEGSLKPSPCRRSQGTIDTLTDDVLEEIFDFYANNWNAWATEWHTLVHVCRRWRRIVFASPRRINLRLVYTGDRALSEMLDTWPVLPLVISGRHMIYSSPEMVLNPRWENIYAALDSEHHNRICEIYVYNIPNSHWGSFSALIQRPFPELTRLYISRELEFGNNSLPTVPDSFLAGSAPRLQMLWVRNCPFPGMQKLLLSANHLVILSLVDIPESGYISPQAMATVLLATTRLETLHLSFQSPRSRPDPAGQRLPLQTRSVLPALVELQFRGVHEYLEDLLGQLDAPLLDTISVTYFMGLVFDVSQLHRFFGHAENFQTLNRAVVIISDDYIWFTHSPRSNHNSRKGLELKIKCRELDWQLSSLAQIFGGSESSLTLLSTLEVLEIEDRLPFSHSRWRDDMEITQWLELLVPFTDVKDLYLSDGVPRLVCHACPE